MWWIDSGILPQFVARLTYMRYSKEQAEELQQDVILVHQEIGDALNSLLGEVEPSLKNKRAREFLRHGVLPLRSRSWMRKPVILSFYTLNLLSMEMGRYFLIRRLRRNMIETGHVVTPQDIRQACDNHKRSGACKEQHQKRGCGDDYREEDPTFYDDLQAWSDRPLMPNPLGRIE